MASTIDATIPAEGVAAVKATFRANFLAAKSEIEALQAEVASIEVGGGITVVSVKTGNYTAGASELVPLDSSGGAFNLTLPLNPVHGTRVQWLYVTETWDTDPVVLLRNGELLDGVEDDVTLDAGSFGEVVYEETAGNWAFVFDSVVHQVQKDSGIATATLSAGAVTCDLEAGDYFAVTINGAWNAGAPLIGSNPPVAGRTKTIQLVATISGSQTVDLSGLPHLGSAPILDTGDGEKIVVLATWEGSSLVDAIYNNRSG